MFAAGNDLTLQRLLSNPTQTIRSPQLTSPYLMSSTPMLDFQSHNPSVMLQSILQQQLLNQLQSPINQQQQLLNQLQLPFLCQQPDFLELLSQLTGAKLVGTKEVQDDRLQEKIQDKVSPVPQLPVLTKTVSRKRSSSSVSPTHPPKKHKNLRRLHNIDVETNSPVSGMWIKDASEVSADDMNKACELDDSAPYVDVNEESRSRVAQIPNIIGGSKCFLCKRDFQDVFRLAMHRCPRIAHQEYNCPECGKPFSCPANLASHRRWHRPRNERSSNCIHCALPFETKKALREHKCLQKMNLSPRNSISSTATSETETTATLSPDFMRSNSMDMPSTPSSSSYNAVINVQEQQAPIISLGLNSGSLQLGNLEGLRDLQKHLSEMKSEQ